MPQGFKIFTSTCSVKAFQRLQFSAFQSGPPGSHR